MAALGGRTAEGIDVASVGRRGCAPGGEGSREEDAACEATGWRKEDAAEWLGVEEMMENRYMLSLEGNDVATDLKWKLASGAVVLMPRPTQESWLQELTLQPGVHYIEVAAPHEVPIKLRWLREHQAEAQAIARAAQRHMLTFTDASAERE